MLDKVSTPPRKRTAKWLGAAAVAALIAGGAVESGLVAPNPAHAELRSMSQPIAERAVLRRRDRAGEARRRLRPGQGAERRRPRRRRRRPAILHARICLRAIRWSASSASSATSSAGRGDRGPRQERPRQFGQSQGSGFFISADGYLVTNNHVVDNGSEVQVTMDDGTDARRQGDRHRSEDRPRPAQGRWRQRLPLRAPRRPEGPHRRLGAGGRQPVRPRRHGHGRHRLGPAPRHRRRPLRRLHPDRRAGEPGQLGRPDLQPRRRGRGREHGDLLAVRRQCRHRLRDPGEHRRPDRDVAEGRAAR